MRRCILHSRCVVAGVATLTLLLTAVSAAAAPVQHYHLAFTCTATPSSGAVYAELATGACLSASPSEDNVEIDPNLCDIPGTLTDNQAANVQVSADGTYKAEFKEMYVFTSALTGKSIESRSDEQQTFSFSTSARVFAFTGRLQQLKLPDGSTLAMDAGPVVFTVTDNGFSVSENGHHDDLYRSLCDVVAPALS